MKNACATKPLKTTNETIVFVGDIVHSHSIQFDHPETSIAYDADPKQAIATRLKLFAEFATDGKTYQWIPIHFKD